MWRSPALLHIAPYQDVWMEALSAGYFIELSEPFGPRFLITTRLTTLHLICSIEHSLQPLMARRTAKLMRDQCVPKVFLAPDTPLEFSGAPPSGIHFGNGA